MHTVNEFDNFIVTMSAESVGGSTPGVRVTWNTTIPPECVTSVTVEFRTSDHGPVVATYTTTNMSHVQTVAIQTGLQCGGNYYTRVVVTAKIRPLGGMPINRTLSNQHPDVQVRVRGKRNCSCDFYHS